MMGNKYLRGKKIMTHCLHRTSKIYIYIYIYIFYNNMELKFQ